MDPVRRDFSLIQATKVLAHHAHVECTLFCLTSQIATRAQKAFSISSMRRQMGDSSVIIVRKAEKVM
jgi:hypothetical protein